jgi:plasmid stability protein
MGQIIVRNLDDRVIDALKARAARRGRSLESKVRVILERAAAERVIDIAEARARSQQISCALEGRPHSESAALIRKDRDR